VRDWEAELAGCEARRGPGIQDGRFLPNPKLEGAGLHDRARQEALAGDDSSRSAWERQVKGTSASNYALQRTGARVARIPTAERGRYADHSFSERVGSKAVGSGASVVANP
jgi:hypothetical protein